MELILKGIQQAPFVALFAWLWWNNRKDQQKRIKFLEEENKAKDVQIEKFIGSFEKLSLTLELIKDRLR